MQACIQSDTQSPGRNRSRSSVRRSRLIWLNLYVCLYTYIHIHIYIYVIYIYSDLTHQASPQNVTDQRTEHRVIISGSTDQGLSFSRSHRFLYHRMCSSMFVAAYPIPHQTLGLRVRCFLWELCRRKGGTSTFHPPQRRCAPARKGDTQYHGRKD